MWVKYVLQIKSYKIWTFVILLYLQLIFIFFFINWWFGGLYILNWRKLNNTKFIFIHQLHHQDGLTNEESKEEEKRKKVRTWFLSEDNELNTLKKGFWVVGFISSICCIVLRAIRVDLVPFSAEFWWVFLYFTTDSWNVED